MDTSRVEYVRARVACLRYSVCVCVYRWIKEGNPCRPEVKQNWGGVVVGTEREGRGIRVPLTTSTLPVGQNGALEHKVIQHLNIYT